MPVLGLVPARAGSKGIPGKNLRPLAGRPPVVRAIEVGRASGVIDRLVVSTDSEEIAELARAAGADVPGLRPPELAQDDTPMVPVIKHAVGALEDAGWRPDVVVLLQPTAPLRRPEHVARAVELLREDDATSVVSVVEIPAHYRPDFALVIDDGHLRFLFPEARQVARRQDARTAYSRDGTVYAFWRDVVMEHDDIYGDRCRPLVLSHDESVNLDSEDDWREAERRLGG